MMEKDVLYRDADMEVQVYYSFCDILLDKVEGLDLDSDTVILATKSVMAKVSAMIYEGTIHVDDGIISTVEQVLKFVELGDSLTGTKDDDLCGYNEYIRTINNQLSLTGICSDKKKDTIYTGIHIISRLVGNYVVSPLDGIGMITNVIYNNI